MENASKALIIAGAILISILIVGLGVIIYNNVSGIASDTSGIDQQAVSSHNSPIESYFSDHTSGSNVRALLTQVQANNSAANRNDEVVGNYIYVVDGSNNILTSSDIRTGKMYTVTYGDESQFTDENGANSDGTPLTSVSSDAAYWSNGFLRTIVITENTGSGSGSNP